MHRLLCIHSALSAHPCGILQRELLGQQRQQVSRPARVHRRSVLGIADTVGEIAHLRPKVVVQAPADEVIDCFLPLAAVSHLTTKYLKVLTRIFCVLMELNNQWHFIPLML